MSKLMRVLSLMLTLAIMATGCGGASEPLRIGVVVDPRSFSAAEAAIADEMKIGPVGKRAVELMLIPNGSGISAHLAIAQAESLTADRSLMAVIGHSNSSASLAASQVYNSRGVVQIAPNSSAPLYSEAGPYSFRMVPSDLYQAKFLADQVTAAGDRPRVAILSVNDDYGRALHRAVRTHLVERDVPIVFEAVHSEVHAMDVPLVARGFAESSAGVLIWLGRATTLRQVLPALHARAGDFDVLGSDGLDGGPYADSTQRAQLLDVRFARYQLDSAGRSSLADRLGIEPGELADQVLLVYDAVRLIVQSLRESGPDRDALRRRIAAVGNERPAYAGLAGDVAFDANGDVARNFVLVEIGAQGLRTVHR